MKNFPSFQDLACGDANVSGCLEWSMVLVGPLYLAFYVMAISIIISIAIVPLSLGLKGVLGKKETIKKDETDA